MASPIVSVAKVGFVNLKSPRHLCSHAQHQNPQQQFSRNRFVASSISSKVPKVEEKFSKLNTKMQRRSFSLVLISTAVWLMAPAALASSKDTEIPEYGPELPKKDIVFQGPVFLARVSRPQPLVADKTQGNVLETMTATSEFNSFRDHKEQEVTPQDFVEEVLELSIEVPRSQHTPFNVFINLPEASQSSPITLPQFVGSYWNEVDRKPGTKRTKARFGIGEKIKLLNLQNKQSILVSMVRHGAIEDKPIVVKDIDIALED